MYISLPVIYVFVLPRAVSTLSSVYYSGPMHEEQLLSTVGLLPRIRPTEYVVQHCIPTSHYLDNNFRIASSSLNLSNHLSTRPRVIHGSSSSPSTTYSRFSTFLSSIHSRKLDMDIPDESQRFRLGKESNGQEFCHL